MCKKTPHKHAEVIKAWADGDEIEFKDHRTGTWYAVSEFPVWAPIIEYRVKPQPVYVRMYKSIQQPHLMFFNYVRDENTPAPAGHEWVSDVVPLYIPS